MLLAFVAAASGDHATYGDAAFIFAFLAGFAAIIWAALR